MSLNFQSLLLCCALSALLVTSSCKNKSAQASSTETTNTSTFYNEPDPHSNSSYTDGIYCAEVEYYNPNTGTQNTYDLSVEVEDGMLTVIHWPNGGWLDDSHFTPEELDSDGSVTFTSDKGYDYTVTITSSSPCSYSSTKRTPSYNSFDEDEDEEEKDPYADADEGSVIWTYRGCHFVIIEISGWYVVADISYGAYSLSRGDEVKGDLTTFGFKKFFNVNDDEEQELYVENYYGTKSRALEKVTEKCGLNTEEDE